MTQQATTFDQALRAWGPEAVAGEPRPGVHDLEVRSVTLAGVACIGRQSSADPASLHWETTLLTYLAESGVPVPVPIPAQSGDQHVAGMTVTAKVLGPHPDTAEDWDAVYATLNRIHALTRDYPLRPGQEPPATVSGRPATVVVGRTRRRDITMGPDGPVLVDWSHAVVGDPRQDFAAEPELRERADQDGQPE